jgi:hypothetical protein
MDERGEIIWLCLWPLLDAFAKQVTASDPTAHYSIERSSNNTFLLRGYVSIVKDATAGDELAITFDAFLTDDGMVTLSSDVSMDNGEILAEGPAVSIQLSAISSTSEGLLAQWLSEFKDFLSSIDSLVKNRIMTLK